jgi:hypothetical protein
MMRKNRNLLLVIVLSTLLALPLLLAACSDDDSDTNNNEAPTIASGDTDGEGDVNVTPPPEGTVAGGGPASPPEVAGEPTVTSSGLQIIDLEVGTGNEAAAGATVTVHYTGWLSDGGTKFDSSLDRGQPATFPLSGVIQGWQEGIPGMKEGGKRRLIIPSDLAYGPQGRPPTIPPDSELIFDVQLLDTQ